MATLGLADRQDGDKGQTTPHEALTSSGMEGRYTIGVRSGIESEGSTGDESTTHSKRGGARGKKKRGDAMAQLAEMMKQQITLQARQHDSVMSTVQLLQQQVSAQTQHMEEMQRQTNARFIEVEKVLRNQAGQDDGSPHEPPVRRVEPDVESTPDEEVDFPTMKSGYAPKSVGRDANDAPNGVSHTLDLNEDYPDTEAESDVSATSSHATEGRLSPALEEKLDKVLEWVSQHEGRGRAPPTTTDDGNAPDVNLPTQERHKRETQEDTTTAGFQLSHQTNMMGQRLG